ncbi:hypothetical protein FOMPIDRAFT_1029983 [Fomitopsis schrenkii]|uniref:HIT-type domain-containing protein n=1 Tax=Fomitopsis schrenkii TaxID=2126942 RepID=S8EDJ1_FOMSC|nr:hypothetical protein FOMPIDRAFT_1029983 [Fomitopsis schrenkii]
MEDIQQRKDTPVNTQPVAEPTASLPCAICRRQFSRYTCPRCNIPYCSLTCFRSESHTNCSEMFYRKELETDIRGDKSKSAEQRQKTLELLRQFEEDSMNDDIFGLDDEDEEEDGDDLERRLGGLDLGAASYDELWAALTPAEREKFTKALRDPDSELAQQLLNSEEIEKVRLAPWWEAPEDDASEKDPGTSSRVQKGYGKKPVMMQVPAYMTRTPPTPGKLPLLLYNACAIMVAYAYVTRYLATSPLTALEPSEQDEARRLISQLVPFLTDRLSKTVHSSLSAAVTDLLSRFQPDAMPLPLFCILLRDAAVLLRPSTVVELTSTAPAEASSDSPFTPVDDLSSHPSALALLVLSDLSALFSADLRSASPLGIDAKTKPNHVTHKLAFYAAYILGVPPVLLRALTVEISERSESIAREGSSNVVTAAHASGSKFRHQTVYGDD